VPDVTYASAGTAFIPEIWAMRAFQVLRANMVLANLVTTDSDVGSFTVGDILHIPFPGTFVANAKAPNTAVQLQTPTDADVTVQLNKHYEVSFLIEDIARAMQNQSIMDRYIQNAVVPLAQQIENDLFALYASFTNSTVSATMDDAQLRKARLALNKQLVPLSNRSIVVAPECETVLLGATNLATYFAFTQTGRAPYLQGTNPAGGIIREGQIGRAYGLDVYMSQLVPLSTTLKNIAFTPDAMILAMRALPEANNPGVDQTVFTDPESRLTFRQTVSYQASSLGLQITLDVLYGVAVLRNLAANVVLTPSTG
jgi:hypothetical protein